MKFINVIDAKEQFSDLVTLLSTLQEDKIILTFNDKPLIEMARIPKKKSKIRRAGIAKGKFTFDDELFDAMDAEIDKMFFGGAAK